jgi:hypothetical protein
VTSMASLLGGAAIICRWHASAVLGRRFGKGHVEVELSFPWPLGLSRTNVS